MAMLCSKSIKAQSSSSLKSRLGGSIKKKNVKGRNKSLLNLSEKTTVVTQCRHDTVQQWLPLSDIEKEGFQSSAEVTHFQAV